jgi:hypothetical protein
VEKNRKVSKEKNLCEKHAHLAHCFPVRVEVVFERDTSCKS